MSARRSAKSALGWAFGISLSILFVSLWGRAVVIDTETLGESLAPLARSETVIDFMTAWMADEMVESGVDSDLVEPTVDYLVGSTVAGQTLDLMAKEVVAAAASPDTNGSSIDMRGLVAPAVPEVTMSLNGLGYPVSEGEVKDVVEGLDPLVIRQPGAAAFVGPTSPTASRLGTASLLATFALIVFGTAYITLSADRVSALRSLLNRVAVGGLSFAILLRVGSWVIDPGGGRAPVPETLSAIAGSKWHVPLQIAGVAALVGAAIFVARRSLRREAASRSASARARPREERRSSLSRSR